MVQVEGTDTMYSNECRVRVQGTGSWTGYTYREQVQGTGYRIQVECTGTEYLQYTTQYAILRYR